METLKVPFLAGNYFGKSVDIIGKEKEEEDEDLWKEFSDLGSPPQKCPNWLNGSCIGGGICIAMITIILFFVYVFLLRDEDTAFTKEFLYCILAAIVALLVSLTCIIFGVWCCCFRAGFWHKRRANKKKRREETELKNFEKRQRKRQEEFADARERHDIIRSKYGLRKDPPETATNDEESVDDATL